MRDVFFSAAAITDLEEIRDYIAVNNPAAAVRLLDAIEKTCGLFGANPKIGTKRDDLLPGVRVFPVKKNYAVFDRLWDEAVEIVRGASRTGFQPSVRFLS